jgi:purine-cytosine permease-like protein
MGQEGSGREAVDVVGKVEHRGVDFIPHDERHSSPRNIFWIFIGANLCVALFVVGWLPVSFGLGWWASLSSVIVGSALGATILVPVSLLGPLTGTNGPVSSGAFFGVVGRIIGSTIALLVNLGFYALSVWTGGAMVVLGLNKLVGLPADNVVLGASYAAVAIVSSIVAIYGHASMVLVERLLIPVTGIVMLVGIYVYAPHFNAADAGGSFLLGGFWPTWLLAVTTATVAVYLYANSICDWTRYISFERHSRGALLTATWAGSFVGLSLPLAFGAYVGIAIGNSDQDIVQGMVALAPIGYLIPLILLGSVGSLGQCTMLLYSSGLDFSSLFPVLRRPVATLLLSVVALVFVFVGTMVWNVEHSLVAFLQLLGVATASWIAVVVLGHFMRGGAYDTDALQVFNRREKGGAYWHWNGWNWRGTVAFVVGTIIGLLFLECALFVGPFGELAGGVDISWLVALFLTGVVYWASVSMFPDHLSSIDWASKAKLKADV